jgi:acetyl-CoA carboxylase biotin carboxyl carrier protein
MLDPKLIRRLARIMSSEGVTELSIEDPENGLKLALKRGQEPAPQLPGPVMLMPGAAPAPAPAAPAAAAAPAAEATGGLAPGVVAIESPMVGTFYSAPSPDSEPFSRVGKRVDEESVVCIIEAMKVLNEIKAELRGEIVEILVENGDPVEFGQPLFLVKKG